MKRILSLIIVISLLFITVSSFVSCDQIIDIGGNIFGDANDGGDENTGNAGGNTDNEGGNTDNEGGNTDNEGGNTDNEGGNTDNEGGNTDNEGGNTDNEGGNTDNEGGNTDNEGGNTDNEGGNTDNEGGNTDNEGGNTDNEGGNTDNEGGNTDNEGGNTDNEGDGEDSCVSHVDANNNDYCDFCEKYLVVVLDFYVFNDLHGKFCDTDTQPGVDEVGTYLDKMAEKDDNIILLASGDMWQGSAESSMTYGKILVEWMNLLGFEAMTIGNHEYDWGEDAIRDNLAVAEFPFLAINIYDNTTGKLADYCTPSVMVERDGVQIGIIGAIGDCYSSISSDMVKNVHFKLGSELTSLVKAESERLRSLGADIIVYSIHDGGGSYDYSLSNGYVDVVFEGHSHSSYKKVDSYGVYHLQGGGENSGLSHVEIAVNYVSGSKTVNEASVVSTSIYSSLTDHQPTEELESKYADLIRYAYGILGTASKNYSDSQLEDFVAQLYLEAGLERWGDRYNIVLGGGYLATRSPYDLDAGDVTYADLNLLFPFDNQIVLCSISGSNLKKKFINSSNSNYHIYLSEYGSSINISNNQTYYVIVDSYTATYSPNGLTIVDTYDETTYARDLLAKAIMDGRLNNIRTYASIFPSSVLGNIKEYYSVQKSMGDKSYAILCAKE